MKNVFNYQSTQVHSDNVDGTKRVRTSRVSIRGSKGFKEVSIVKNGKRKTSKKKLSKKEMDCIRKCQFIPGLFRDCEKCIA